MGQPKSQLKVFRKTDKQKEGFLVLLYIAVLFYVNYLQHCQGGGNSWSNIFFGFVNLVPPKNGSRAVWSIQFFSRAGQNGGVGIKWKIMSILEGLEPF